MSMCIYVYSQYITYISIYIYSPSIRYVFGVYMYLDICGHIYIYIHTVDGRNPAPPGMYKTLQIINNGTFIISTGAGFLPSTVCM